MLFQRLKQRLGLALLGLVILLFIFLPWHHLKPRKASLSVEKVNPHYQTFEQSITAVGKVEAAQTVILTPEVSGQVKQIHFQPGAWVKAGQLLFELESDALKANLDVAQATLARDKAQALYLNAEAQRYANLVKQEYVTRDQNDQAQAAAKAQSALIEADEANVQAAQVQLDHTQIVSPLTGQAGNYTLRVGDLVVADTTPLVTINQLDPLRVDFTLSQPQWLKWGPASRLMGRTVEIRDSSDQTLIAKGQVDFIDNQVNPSTGTILFKAKVKGASLWPGQVVSARLMVKTLPKALVIPLSAVQFDEEGAFVYVAEQDRVNIKRMLVLDQDKNWALIQHGLEPNDQVLTIFPPDIKVGDPLKMIENKP